METLCQSCGAPARPGVIVCEFCEKPVSAEAAANAVACPACKTLNAAGVQQCTHCKAWLVVQCVFCQQLSPYTASACVSCSEVFVGSAERKAARDQELQHQKTMDTIGMIAPVAVGALGVVAGAVIGSHWGSSGNNAQPQYGNQGYGSPPPQQSDFLGNVIGRVGNTADRAVDRSEWGTEQSAPVDRSAWGTEQNASIDRSAWGSDESAGSGQSRGGARQHHVEESSTDGDSSIRLGRGGAVEEDAIAVADSSHRARDVSDDDSRAESTDESSTESSTQSSTQSSDDESGGSRDGSEG